MSDSTDDARLPGRDSPESPVSSVDQQQEQPEQPKEVRDAAEMEFSLIQHVLHERSKHRSRIRRLAVALVVIALVAGLTIFSLLSSTTREGISFVRWLPASIVSFGGAVLAGMLANALDTRFGRSSIRDSRQETADVEGERRRLRADVSKHVDDRASAERRAA